MTNIEKILKERSAQEFKINVGSLEFDCKSLSAFEEEQLDIELFDTISSSEVSTDDIQNNLGDTKGIIKLIGPEAFVKYLYNKKVAKCSLSTGLSKDLIAKLTKNELDELFSKLEEL